MVLVAPSSARRPSGTANTRRFIIFITLTIIVALSRHNLVLHVRDGHFIEGVIIDSVCSVIGRDNLLKRIQLSRGRRLARALLTVYRR